MVNVDGISVPSTCVVTIGGAQLQVFYSAHTDEVDAVTVRHPCMVFFMPAKALGRQGPPKVCHVAARNDFTSCRNAFAAPRPPPPRSLPARDLMYRL